VSVIASEVGSVHLSASEVSFRIFGPIQDLSGTLWLLFLPIQFFLLYDVGGGVANLRRANFIPVCGGS
jgi:hypothetical protein